MLQHVAAANQIGPARIFYREISPYDFDTAKTCCRSVSGLARIIAFAVIASVAKETEEITGAASDFNDILVDGAVAVEHAIGHHLRVLSIPRRERQCVLEAPVIVDPSLIECRINNVTAIGAVFQKNIAARSVRRVGRRCAKPIAQRRYIGDRNQLFEGACSADQAIIYH